MIDTAQLAQRTLDRLRRTGWVRGLPVGPDGEECLRTAMTRACGVEQWTLRNAAAAAIETGATIIGWNDAPDRTWEDVEELLRELGAR